MVDDSTTEGGRPPVITNKHQRKYRLLFGYGSGVSHSACIIMVLVQGALARWCIDSCGWSKYYCDLSCNGGRQCLDYNAVYYRGCTGRCKGRYNGRCINSCSRAWFSCSSRCSNNQCSCNCGVARDRCYQNCKVSRRLTYNRDLENPDVVIEDDSKICLAAEQNENGRGWVISVLNTEVNDGCVCCGEAGTRPQLSSANPDLPTLGYGKISEIEVYRQPETGSYCARDVSGPEHEDRLAVANISCLP